jgi:arsenate reductase (thioredoxin)
VVNVAGLTPDKHRWIGLKRSAPYFPSRETTQTAHFLPTTSISPIGGQGHSSSVTQHCDTLSVRSGGLRALHILKWSRLPCPNLPTRGRAVPRRAIAAVAAPVAAAAVAVPATADGREAHALRLGGERGPIADGGSDLLREPPPPAGWRATSAGTTPAVSASVRTQPMLEERGFASPDHTPQLLTNELMGPSRVRITMGCLDDASCPARLQTLELRDWALPDPASLDDAGFRAVRDQIQARVEGPRRELALRDLRKSNVIRSAPQ